MTYNTINDAQTIAESGEGTLLAGRYRVVRQLGQGGMGSVWLAEDTQLDNKPFAIKMLPSILVANKRAYRQLKDEALVAMKLTHPNIVTLRAFEENNGNPFLVMDYIDGQTLDDYLADYGGRVEHVERVEMSEAGRDARPARPLGGLPEADVLRILRPIAAALDYAHSKGVVHRDVKPGNVIIAKDGTPYIIDFGIAREIQETMTRVTGRLSSGTLLYMSPEQNNGDEPTAAQDIYSFAAMAYECLAGRPPFTRGNIEDQIKNKIPDPPPGGTQLVASVMSELAKKPDDRPPTCAAVLEGNGSSRVEHVERVETVGARAPVLSSFSEGGPRARSVEVSLLKSVTATHNKVQLWEGGPYWAETNIGAENPRESGYYFWWGDTVGYKYEDGVWMASDGSSSGFSFSEGKVPILEKVARLRKLGDTGFVVSGFEKKSSSKVVPGAKTVNVLVEASELLVTRIADGRQVTCMIGLRNIPMPSDKELSDQEETSENEETELKPSFNSVLSTICRHSFGEKYLQTRMTKDMWQEEGKLAVKPVLASYRQFRRLELGYAIEGKRLCKMLFFAPLNGRETIEKIDEKLHDIRHDLEVRFRIAINEEREFGGGGRNYKYEDGRYRMKLWIQDGAKPGIC